MSLLSSLFKTKKVNLTPDVPYKTPDQASPHEVPLLRDFANRRIAGNDLGFGPEFVDKTTNPVANSMRRNFEQFTAPKISSNYSARGLGRSSLAANEQGRAQGDVEANIGNLMAQNYALNEAQKKTDQTQALNLGQNLANMDIGQSDKIAGASERLANATAQDARAREARDTGLATNLVNMALGATTGGASSLGGSFQGFMPTSNQYQGLGLDEILAKYKGSTKANLLY